MEEIMKWTYNVHPIIPRCTAESTGPRRRSNLGTFLPLEILFALGIETLGGIITLATYGTGHEVIGARGGDNGYALPTFRVTSFLVLFATGVPHVDGLMFGRG